jgi:hypothetical protein
MRIRFALTLLATAAAVCGALGTAQATTISNGSFSVGVDASGALYDDSSGVGIRRLSDGYDPLEPGSPRDSWGLSYGSTSASGDPYDYGNSNESSVSSFGASSGTVTNNIGSGAMTLVQTYSFAADNVVKIQESITNNTGSAQTVLFQRDVDWDVYPTEFDEVTTIPGSPPAPVSNDSYYGFENPDPLVGYSDSGYPGGGTQGPEDLGGGIAIDLGTLAAGGTDTFDYYYGISNTDQSESGLVSEIQGLGANFVVATDSSDGSCPTCGTNSAAIAFGPSTAVPEPITLVLFGSGLLGMGYVRRRTRKA